MTETTPPKFFQLVTLKELNRKISLITDNRILDEVIDDIIANVPFYPRILYQLTQAKSTGDVRSTLKEGMYVLYKSGNISLEELRKLGHFEMKVKHCLVLY